MHSFECRDIHFRWYIDYICCLLPNVIRTVDDLSLEGPVFNETAAESHEVNPVRVDFAPAVDDILDLVTMNTNTKNNSA